MIQLFVSLAGGTFLILFGFSFFEQNDFLTNEEAEFTPVAVVELFTSQGCSSCPPADKVLSELTEQGAETGNAIFALSFHVDYWNYLGWADPYSDSQYSERQRRYAQKLSSQVYTPQMVVNGQSQFIGSRKNEAVAHVEEALGKNVKAKVELKQEYDQDKALIQLDYNVEGHDAGHLLQVALTQKSASTAVKKGENRGRNLSHSNIVRVFETVTLDREGKGNLKIEVPEDLDMAAVNLIGYVQDTRSLEIIGASKISL